MSTNEDSKPNDEGTHALGRTAPATAPAPAPARTVEDWQAALRIEPGSARLRVKLGDALKDQGRFEEAIRSYDAALACSASGGDSRRVAAAAWNNRGNVLRTLGRVDEAIESFGKALEAAPGHLGAWFNLGNALKAQHRHHAAIACYDRVLQLRPDHAVAANNRGVSLGAVGRLEASIESLELAIRLAPDNPEPRWNKGVALLLAGDYDNGWQLYENRWTNDNTGMKRRRLPRPCWLGKEPLAGRTVLLHAEQGLGDTLQFSRFARSVADQGAEVVLQAPRALMEILRSLGGVTRLIANGEALPDFDLHCPLMSLPLALGIGIDEVPLREGYLRAPDERRLKWRATLGEGSRPRIGLVWSGNPAHSNDHNRSLPLARLLDWLPRGPEYFSLQRECRAADRAALAMNPQLRHFGEALEDFADTAAVCEEMDLVISVDTSVAHLSAALGCPTWILLPFVPDWRWLLEREDSPWYESVRLFRQPRIDDWDGALQQLGDALAAWRALRGPSGQETVSGVLAHPTATIEDILRLRQANRLEAAEETARTMLRANPAQFDAAHALAVVLAQRGETQGALEAFERALRLQPGNADAWSNRGHALRTARRLEESVDSYDRAISLRKELSAAWLGKALCLADLGRLETSLECFEHAIRQSPEDAQAYFLRADVLRRLDRLEAALESHDRALALRPGHAEGWDKRGLVLEALGRVDEAIASHDRAILMAQGDARAERNKGMALLLQGKLEEGFRLYERRWDVEPMASAMPSLPRPRWRGEVPLEGRTLLLHSEQGLGDILQFCRYAALAAQAGAKVLLEVPETLTGLMHSLTGKPKLVRRGEDLPEFDLHCPLMSLPFAFRTRLDTIPDRAPYLFADPARIAQWRDRFGDASVPTVGLAWSGNPQHAKDAQRSLALEALLPHLPEGPRYVALQREIRPTDLQVLERSERVLNVSDRIVNFSDTAALCAAVDLIVSVDTSIAHLAGALGRPTWILLPFAPDWRWMLGREDSPWYPTARLYRQHRRGDWAPVLERLSRDLSELVDARTG